MRQARQQAEEPAAPGTGVRELVIHAQAGNLAAYESLVARFQDAAVAYAYARLGDFHLAEDAAQEAFVQAYRDLPALRETDAFAGWLRRIVASRCTRFTRKQRLRLVPLEQAALAASPDAIALRESDQTVALALRELPAAERTAAALFYVGGYSHAEIAAFLSVPISTVNNRLHAARTRLKRSMESMVGNHMRGAQPSKDTRFVADVLRLLAPTPQEHGTMIYEALEAQNAGWAGTQWREGRLAHSHFDWSASRVGMVGDHLATIFGVYDVTMRVGVARARVAGVNLEYIDHDLTRGTRGDDSGHSGHSGRQDDAAEDAFTQTAASSIDALQKAGYDLSVAFGNESFFHRLGYVFGWRELLWFVRTRDLPAETPRGELLEFEPVHRDDLAALYNREHDTLTGTAVRPTYLRNKEPGGLRGYLWSDGAGVPVGYVTVGPEAVRDWRNAALVGRNHKGYESLLWHDESAGDPDERLRVLGMLARQVGAAEVAFSRLHYWSPLGKRLRKMPCRIEKGYRTYVMKIVDLARLFGTLAPELERRLAPSHLADWSGDLLVTSGEQAVRLSIVHGRVRVAPATPEAPAEHAILAGPELAQLVVGTEPAREVIEAAAITLRGSAAALADVLFPAQHPQMENQAL
jgi:RNA polymerase sigma factor (sigma-70 family)